MRHSPHLVISISGHGFGHVAQTAPILNTLHQLMPQLRITVRSSVAIEYLRSRIHAPFTYRTSEGDIGMLMSSALDVHIENSRSAYHAFHADWDKRVEEEARILREFKADFVLSNVGYLPLAGAQLAGIANAALCSLNWSDIYRHYCLSPSTKHLDPTSKQTIDETIAGQIHTCYAQADAFLRATPGMAMNRLPNRFPIAPIAAVGTNRREELNARLRLSPNEKLALISMGGIASRFPIEQWPHIDGVRWVVQESWLVKHPDSIVLESLHMSFGDVLASSDALICKPGYGSFVEATCSGIPVIYVNRPDWPESFALTEWLHQHNTYREISRQTLELGTFQKELEFIWNEPKPTPIIPDGATQVANWLVDKLN